MSFCKELKKGSSGDKCIVFKKEILEKASALWDCYLGGDYEKLKELKKLRGVKVFIFSLPTARRRHLSIISS